MSLPKYPPTAVAMALCLTGVVALLIALWLQLPMWMAVFGLRPVAPGGGEYMLALFFGLPGLLLSLLLLGMATARAAWRSKTSAIALVLALGVVLGWLALLLRSLFV